MSTSSENIELHVHEYATARGLRLEQRLGYGKDGTVFMTHLRTAIKAFAVREAFERELACYLRLQEQGIHDVLGHAVPGLVDWDADLLAIEMTVVSPPFLLDFAGAYLDFAPDFSDEVIQQWTRDKQEEFGAHWPDVVALLNELALQVGIHMLDVNPGNIRFGNEGVGGESS